MWGIDWIDVAQDWDRWWAIVNVVMKLQAPSNVGIAEDLLASQEGLCFKELIS
jgi:hypothetical protein